MKPEEEVRVPLPVALALAMTRALGGIGVGLLVAERMDRESRRAVGRALLAAGIASTVPLVRRVVAAYHKPEPAACAVATAG